LQRGQKRGCRRGEKVPNIRVFYTKKNCSSHECLRSERSVQKSKKKVIKGHIRKKQTQEEATFSEVANQEKRTGVGGLGLPEIKRFSLSRALQEEEIYNKTGI